MPNKQITFADRKACNFYRSFWEVALMLPEEEQGPYLMAILNAEFTGQIVEPNGPLSKLAFAGQKHAVLKQLEGFKHGPKAGPPQGPRKEPSQGPRQQEQVQVQVQVQVQEQVQEQVELTTSLPPKGGHPLVKWLHTSLPTIQKLKEPLTDAEADRLVSDFDKEAIREVFEAMANTADLLKKYKSANLTFRNWMKRRQEANPNYGKKKVNQHGYSEQEIKMRKEAFGGYLTKEEQERAIRIERGLEKA